jgi:hypothetical protein
MLKLPTKRMNFGGRGGFVFMISCPQRGWEVRAVKSDIGIILILPPQRAVMACSRKMPGNSDLVRVPLP